VEVSEKIRDYTMKLEEMKLKGPKLREEHLAAGKST
jgi:hypothetical protein